MSNRTYPFGFLGGNLSPYRYYNQGFTLEAIEGTDKFTKTCSGTAGQSTIAVSNNGNVEIGQYVTGVGIPAVNNINQPLIVSGISGNTITLNGTLKTSISNLNVYFFKAQNSVEYLLNTMAASGTEFLRSSFWWKAYQNARNGAINWTGPYYQYGEFDNIETFLKLTSLAGIDTMIRWGGPPDWAIDYDYAVDKAAPFTFQNPANDQPLKHVGVRVAASGTVGSSVVTVKDMKRAPLIVPNMVINNQTGFTNGTKITKVQRNATNYSIYLDKPLTQTITDTTGGQPNYNLTAGISNFENYNVVNGVQKSIYNGDTFRFDSFDDLNIYLINLRRKGGSIPKDYKDFAKFFNQSINYFGSKGSYWESNDFPGREGASTQTTAFTNKNSILFQQTITISTNLTSYPNIKNIVVGMSVESDSYSGVPATSEDGDRAYIPTDTKITAIKGNVITLSNSLNQNIPSGVGIKFKFPKVTNWQIWNEGDSLAYSGNNWSKSTTVNNELKYRIGDETTPLYTIPDITSSFMDRGANWPQHWEKITGKVSNTVNKTITLVDETYGWAPTFVNFIKVVKEEGHATDSKCRIISNALTDPDNSYPKMFEKPNGRYCYDIFGINTYPQAYLGEQELITRILDYRPTFETYYGKGKLNYPTLPDLVLSEYGWSTDLVGYTYSKTNGSAAATETQLAEFLDLLISGVSTKKNFEDIINNSYYWNIKSVAYFNWASEETGFLTSSGDGGSDNIRGIYKWQHPNIKSGTVTNKNPITNVNELNKLFFSNPLPPDWATGYKLYVRNETGGLNGIQNGSLTITAIASDRKSITLSANLSGNVATTLGDPYPLSEGESTVGSGGDNECYLYIQNKLRDKMKITDASVYSTGKIKYTMEHVPNFITTNENTVMITGITGTGASGLNGTFTVIGRPNGSNGKTFIVANSTTGFSNLNFNNAYVLGNMQPKLPAVSLQDASLSAQGRV